MLWGDEWAQPGRNLSGATPLVASVCAGAITWLALTHRWGPGYDRVSNGCPVEIEADRLRPPLA